MEPIEKVDVYCTDKDKTVSCDVLRKTDKHMRVVLPGDLPLNLDRNDTKKAIWVTAQSRCPND